jgi:hypothetical protein
MFFADDGTPTKLSKSVSKRPVPVTVSFVMPSDLVVVLFTAYCLNAFKSARANFCSFVTRPPTVRITPSFYQ